MIFIEIISLLNGLDFVFSMTISVIHKIIEVSSNEFKFQLCPVSANDKSIMKHKSNSCHKAGLLNICSRWDGIMGCFTIRVHLQKLHSSPVLTVEAYFDFKVLLPKH